MPRAEGASLRHEFVTSELLLLPEGVRRAYGETYCGTTLTLSCSEGRIMFSRSRLGLLVALLLAGAGWALLGPQATTIAGEKRLKVGNLEVSGPYSHNNLTICLIHGPDELKGRKFMMLAEALEQKKLTIYETQ